MKKLTIILVMVSTFQFALYSNAQPQVVMDQLQQMGEKEIPDAKQIKAELIRSSKYELPDIDTLVAIIQKHINPFAYRTTGINCCKTKGKKKTN